MSFVFAFNSTHPYLYVLIILDCLRNVVSRAISFLARYIMDYVVRCTGSNVYWLVYAPISVTQSLDKPLFINAGCIFVEFIQAYGAHESLIIHLLVLGARATTPLKYSAFAL